MIKDADIFNLLAKQPEPRNGDVIIAEPFLSDPIFGRSCVLIARHSNEIDTMGFILNRRLDISLDEIIDSVSFGMDIPVFIGGPLSSDRLFYIHDIPLPDSLPINGELYLNGDFDTALEILQSEPEAYRHFKFFIGYSGWSKHQLSEEIDIHTWAVCQHVPVRTIMATDTNELWRDCISLLGPEYKNWGLCPENISLN